MNLRRDYETTFIVNAALEDADIESVISKVTGYIENHGGQINEIHRWGRRRLAYPINKKYNGYYVNIVYEATASTIPILERFMVLEDTVLRHLSLILPKKLSEFRVKRAIERGGTVHDALSGKPFDKERTGEYKDKVRKSTKSWLNQEYIEDPPVKTEN
ncbi:MAG: 30S ribosomal protein S6 [FCB group bacterium]|jgi:small subunit ribosomal protein S6